MYRIALLTEKKFWKSIEIKALQVLNTSPQRNFRNVSK